MKVRRALVSVSDKSGLEPFARALVGMGVQIISTGGTARSLKEAGLPVTLVSEVTGFPEIMDGRVKTLHPSVHGGILADRDVPEHLKAIADLGIEPIDLVVVNLYPFERTVANPDVTWEEAIENIDIGGPTMVRAAAKNHSGVAIIVDPRRYEPILAEMKANDGEISLETRRTLASEAFQHTAHYDSAIAGWFGRVEGDFPSYLNWDFRKVQDVRYGENPHQKGAFYADMVNGKDTFSEYTQLHGQTLSFNNLLDLDAARRCCDEFEVPCCIIIKHNNPCGAALADTIALAYDKALSCDPVSGYGSVIAVNRTVDEELATALSKNFVEVLYAPSYLEEALEILTKKADIRILVAQDRPDSPRNRYDIKRVSGGVLLQEKDASVEERDAMTVVTTRHPTEAEWGDLLFAWRIAKHLKSNAIVVCKDLMTIGVGCGQMSRVDSSKIAVQKARFPFTGAVVASDAFFPFPDALEVVANEGVVAAIQPGGSKRDDESFQLAESRGMAIVTTGRRHFRH